jgi:hypothetical protein
MWRGLLLIVLLCGVARADPSTTSISPSTNPADHVWHLSSYLHGTPSEIREQVNGELERLLRLRATRQDALKDATEALRAARKGPNVRAAQARVKQATDALKETDLAVARAYLWRKRLIDGVRGKFTMRWPLNPGAKGILGIVTPLRITREPASILIDFPALETLRVEDQREGIRREKMLVHDVPMVVTGGLDLDAMRVGKPVALDQNYTVLSSRIDPRNGPVYTVSRQPSDVDELMKAVNDLREPIDRKEMAALVRRSVPQKADPKLWHSVDRMLATTRPVSVDDRDSAARKQLSAWLGRALPGDLVAMRVDVLKVLPSDDGTYELHATVPAGEGRVHFITGTLLPGEQGLGRRMEGQNDVRISGKILDAELSEENTLILELIDVDIGG